MMKWFSVNGLGIVFQLWAPRGGSWDFTRIIETPRFFFLLPVHLPGEEPVVLDGTNPPVQHLMNFYP